ncbi:MAG: hypothetical protein V4710_04920, partial [Verrucomicrobiota bacterium]
MERRSVGARILLMVGIVLMVVSAGRAAETGRALVRHVPAVNGNGLIEGSVQQMLGESLSLNGGATITSDLLVPGTPTLQLNGKPSFGGTIQGTGSTVPSNYTIQLNGGARLGHLMTRTAPVALPAVNAPPAPSGTRNVVISSPGQSVGAWATVRDLTLNGNVGQYAVPPGTYGTFTGNGGTGLTLGVAGATQPAIYHFQRLNLNGKCRIVVVGPVIVTLANG